MEYAIKHAGSKVQVIYPFYSRSDTAEELMKTTFLKCCYNLQHQES